MEQWRAIEGYEGMYEISNLGRIRSLHHSPHGFPGLVLALQQQGDYSTVTLSRNGIKTRCRVHLLVAHAFVPNPKKLPYITHINRDNHDNRVSNLVWTKARGTSPGAEHPRAYLTEEDVRQIRKTAEVYRVSKISRIVDLPYGTVSKIVKRERWKNV